MTLRHNLFTRFLKSSLFILLVCLTVSNARADGELDQSFASALITPTSGRVSATAIQPDGKIVAYGPFSAVSGVPTSSNLVRLNADGTLDTSFNAPNLGASSQVVPEIAFQSTGKIIISGGFSTVGGQTVWGIVRLNADGSFDNTFVVNNFVSWLYDVEVLPDDKILAPYGNQGLKRLMPDGTIDPTFAGNSTFYIELAVQPDAKILAVSANGNILSRLNADGTPDASFTPATFNSRVWDIKVQADGKILAAGQFATLNGFSRSLIARVNSDGTGDPTFTSPFSSGVLFKVIPLPDGKIVVGGTGVLNTGSANRNVFRLNADGTNDLSFTQSIPMEVFDLDRQTDGKIIISGEATSTFGHVVTLMYRLNADGTADTTFKASFGWSGEGRKIFVQPDGKILVAGRFHYANNTPRVGVVRFNQDGSVDTSFNAQLTYTQHNLWYAIDMQPDGKIIVGDSYAGGNARRLNPDGSLDVVFPDSLSVNDIKVLSSGKILIVAFGVLKRYNSDGSQDVSFNVTSSGEISKIAVQPDGKILIGGYFTMINSVNRGRIARLNADGTLDNTFDTSTGASGPVLDVVLLNNGQILIGGSFSGFNFVNRPYIARLNANGSLDTSFISSPNGAVFSIKVQPNNKILIGGSFTTVNGISRPRIARLHQDGGLDASFNPGSGANSDIFDVELQSDGKILIAGTFTSYNGILKYGIARLENSLVSRTLFDYDGDGKADISVFRPSENRWYVLRSSDFGVTQQVFAVAGDVPVPSDFDGDGKTDFAIFRPSTADWWYLSSINSAQVSAHWGEIGAIPRPSDFDGDGKSDYIYFQPSNSTWYRYGSIAGVSNKNFGLAGDKPVTGDFDGDGKSDVAIFRPSTGDWWWQSSIDNGQRATRWGISTDIPAPADFDGDGRTDFAVYRPSTGVWYVINSSNGSFTIFNFGISEDKPVPADYDGDGKADIAVFRPSTGTWYLQQSTAGFTAVQFGISTDIPTENAFVP